MQKKASLQLSIQAIVVIVIAITVLSLGIVFVQNMFKDITSTTGEIQARTKESILETMRSQGKKLSMAQEIVLERGEETVENIGIVNTEISPYRFGILIDPIKKQTPEGDEEDVPEGEVTFFYSKLIDKELSQTEGDVIPVTIKAQRSASGTYLFKVTVFREKLENSGGCATLAVSEICELHDTRSFFVKIA